MVPSGTRTLQWDTDILIMTIEVRDTHGANTHDIGTDPHPHPHPHPTPRNHFLKGTDTGACSISLRCSR